MAISKLANGFYTFSDNHFKAMRKQDLINYIRTIENNWENALITNAIQYDNCKRLLAEERNKAIDKFAETLLSQKVVDKSVVKRIAEQMKAGDEV